MCGFCAVFAGAPHWTEDASDAGDRDSERSGHAWRLGRQRRLALVNQVLACHGCRVDDWMGGQFMVHSQRGRTEMVDAQPQVWQVAEAIAGHAIDPLDPEFLAALAARGRRPHP